MPFFSRIFKREKEHHRVIGEDYSYDLDEGFFDLPPQEAPCENIYLWHVERKFGTHQNLYQLVDDKAYIPPAKTHVGATSPRIDGENEFVYMEEQMRERFEQLVKEQQKREKSIIYKLKKRLFPQKLVYIISRMLNK